MIARLKNPIPLVQGSYRCLHLSRTTAIKCGDVEYSEDEMTNVPPKIMQLISRKLLNVEGHPLNLIKRQITNFFTQPTQHLNFDVYDQYSPVVTPGMTFDSLYIPKDHIIRNKSDTYYLNKDNVLRPHTSAHQIQTLKQGSKAFLVFGDVYRRDELDSTHYPVFHQVELVKLFTQQELAQLALEYNQPHIVPIHTISNHITTPTNINNYDNRNNETIFKADPVASEPVIVYDTAMPFIISNGVETEDCQAVHFPDAVKIINMHFQRTMEELISTILGSHVEKRWNTTFFPFTHPSQEMEIFYNDKWVEIFGGGIMKQQLITDGVDSSDHNLEPRIGWAAGIGLERLAMVLYEIKDIRLFWTPDLRFINQFKDKDLYAKIKFKPYSTMPPCIKDISLWINETPLENNDVYDLFRNVAGDLIESIELIDEYANKKSNKKSKCFRINYRSLTKTLTNQEVMALHKEAEAQLVKLFNVSIR